MPNPTYSDSDTDQGELIDLVEYRIDQVTADGQTIGINRSNAYRELVEAVREVMRQAPPELLDELAVSDDAASVSSTDAVTKVECPENYLRFRSLELTDWEREVTSLIPYGSDAWRLQWNRYAQADAHNPVVAQKPTGGGGFELQAFPPDSSDSLEQLVYYPDDQAPEAIPDDLKDAVASLGAARMLSNQQEYNAAQALEGRASKALGGVQFGIIGENMRSDGGQ